MTFWGDLMEPKPQRPIKRSPVTKGRLAAIFLFIFLSILPYQALAQSSFRFIAWGDTKTATATLQALSPQAKALDPNFYLYMGDLVESGFNQADTDVWKSALNGGTGNGTFDPDPIPASPAGTTTG